MEDDPIVNEIFVTKNLNNNQDMIQVMNKEVRISEASIKKSTKAG